MSKTSELIPNSFQVPNLLVDRLLPFLNGPQTKVVLLVCRKTFGWGKRVDLISLGQFEQQAGLSRSSVYEALETFVRAGLLLKSSRGPRQVNEWSLNLEADAEDVIRFLAEASNSEKKPVCIAQRTSSPSELVRPANQICTAQRTTPSSPGEPTETQYINPKPKSNSSNAAPSGIEEAFEYFRERLKRSPHYELTPERRRMGEAGLRACEKLARLNGSADSARDAMALLRLAIDRLAESPWHNGENATGAKYLDWEVLFRGRNLSCPRKLIDYWLNDEKFPDHGRGAA